MTGNVTSMDRSVNWIWVGDPVHILPISSAHDYEQTFIECKDVLAYPLSSSLVQSPPSLGDGKRLRA